MNYAVIAVGGTGKRVALLYLKMVNILRPSNVTSPGSNVFVIDMDPEPNTDDGRLNDELEREGVPKSHFVSPVNEDARVNKAITLSQYVFGSRDITDVAHALFNANQLKVQVIKGMNCEPTVGATVATRRFNTISQEPEIQQLEDRISPFQQIVIVGSLIGGTGAGVTSQLVSWIHRRQPAKHIYGVLYLQWLSIPDGAPDEPSDLKMVGNTKAWLNYLLEHHPGNRYGSSDEMFRHYVLIGAPSGMRLNRVDSESHHPLHLLGAIHLLQFDDYVLKIPGANGPHYIELSEGLKPSKIRMGEDSMEKAVIREKLLTTLLGEFKKQRPDEALSSFTLFMRDRLAWPTFINTLERIAARWDRRKYVGEDWRSMCDVFMEEKVKAEARIEELKKLTGALDGTGQIFDFDWNYLQQQVEEKLADARIEVRTKLKDVSVAFPGLEETRRGAARKYMDQSRSLLRELKL